MQRLMSPLTLGLQLLLLLPPPRVVVIFRQLFCHSLGVDAESQGPDSEDVLSHPKTPPHHKRKDEGSHLQLPGQSNSAEVGWLGVVPFSRIIGLGGQERNGGLGGLAEAHAWTQTTPPHLALHPCSASSL